MPDASLYPGPAFRRPDRGNVRTVVKILLAQIALAALAGAVAAWAAGPVAGYSALLGGVICVTSHGFLSLRMWLSRASGSPRRMLNAMYCGEAGKLALSAVFFALVFVFVQPLSAGALIAGFIVAQGGIWLAVFADESTLTT